MIPIEMKVQSRFAELSKSEQMAASYFLEHKEHIFQYPLATLAKMSNTSQGAWVRAYSFAATSTPSDAAHSVIMLQD